MPACFSVLLLLVVTWGVFAFGAVYDWAYTPLFCALSSAKLAAAVGPIPSWRDALARHLASYRHVGQH